MPYQRTTGAHIKRNDSNTSQAIYYNQFDATYFASLAQDKYVPTCNMKNITHAEYKHGTAVPPPLKYNGYSALFSYCY